MTAGDMKNRAEHVKKFQCVFEEEEDTGRIASELQKDLDIVRSHVDGSFVTLVVRDKTNDAKEILTSRAAVLIREAPMSLEEVFIAEMEGRDYDIRKVLH